MRLKKIDLYGFKSFAQKTEIVFGEGITGIVGPNGSGKSNIGDAVRWVLGEQSAKMLRGTNMADVIFNGTQKKKPLNYCEVSLAFDNSDHTLSSDYSDIQITRRVFRNGESEYYINQSSCRLKDVIDLFRDTGIGKEGYSIIGQGRIDEILSRKSEDRRMIFEEAAGIVKFKSRKEEADRKLEKTIQNEERITDIIDELARQLEPLEEQSRAARQFLEWSEELKKLELNLFLIRSDRMKQKIKKLKEDIDNLTQVISDYDSLLQEKNEKRDESQKKIELLTDEIDRKKDQLLKLSTVFHEYESENRNIQTQIDTREENRQQLLSDISAYEERIRKLAEHQRLQDESALEIKKTLEDENQQLLSLQSRLNETTVREQECSDRLEKHKDRILDAINRRSVFQNDRTRLETLLSQIVSRREEMDRLRNQQAEKKEHSESILMEASEKLKTEVQALESIQAEQTRIQGELDQYTFLVSDTYGKMDTLTSRIQATRSQYQLLVEMSQELDGYQQSVKKAIRYSKDQSIQGVHGVLAQLLSVPEQYETAIDMALGGALQNIVTDNEHTAKTLIDYLRSHQLGRATFLPISSIHSKHLSQEERLVLQMPGCIGIASDLIHYQPAYRSIVENLLGRTVIADELEHGISIMRAGNQSFRLVTLKGDVMHSGGSMTGGSVHSRYNSLLGKEREIKNLKALLDQLDIEYEKTRNLLEDYQNKKAGARSSLSDVTEQFHQQEISVARENERLESLKADMKDLNDRILETEEAIAQLDESLSSIQQQMHETSIPGDDADFDQEEMDQKTREYQDQLAVIRNDVQSLTNQITEKKLLLSDLDHQMETLHREKTRNEQDCSSLLKENENRREKIQQFLLLTQQNQEQLLELKRLSDEKQKEMSLLEDSILNLENDRHDHQSTLKLYLEDIDRMHVSLNQDQERKHRLEIQYSKQENDLKYLEERIWNTYELTYGGAEEFRTPESINEAKADSRVRELNSNIRNLGPVNVNAMEEYAATKERFTTLTEQKNDLTKAEQDLKELIEQLLEQMKKTFEVNFEIMKKYFTETFVRLFGGGHAELLLTDPSDPLNCGIEINAQPPGKKLQLLSLLSGGERALTAIAILFAMLKLKPTPFCILDEIEAALDDANIGYYADYLKEYSENTQFIVITHRKGTMERCNVLYGVAMEEQGVSKMVSVSLQDYDE